MPTQVFDQEAIPAAWFDADAAGGMFDRDILTAATASFDGALMAAMSRPWRDIAFLQPLVVASGMTPPDNVPT